MKITSIGADISGNDVSCSKTLIENVKKDIPDLLKIGAYKAALTNITGDDVVISAFVEDEKLVDVNRGIVDILRSNAEDLGDIEGISPTREEAGEGVSYAEANIRQDRYPDAIIIAFDTYGGESFVHKVADSVMKAAQSMDNVTDIGGSSLNHNKEIPGVGYVSAETDDPVVVTTVEDIESMAVVGGAMMGAALGNKNVYLVRRGSPSYVIPGSVIMSITAYMNGNVMDLAVPLSEKMKILKV
ncbi:hypothetical protein [Methanobacterium petrolearium]|uniref:hypothetical protein n=1 Tax=Methanobacterium petrolearium TaxID=710190 RepID=UPI001AE7B8F4|nr:hypothetical protein [Methanobacterium petrolearium]MBP1945724.1 hypothetical protein [Methanobacterium petrolearium]BDZ71972.1 hypothetical protein GCM10025861_24890 [Methanobacterium petrolearium]